MAAFCTVATIANWKPNAERLQRLLRELRVGLAERLVEHQLRENWLIVRTFGAGQVEAQRARKAERHQLLLLAAGVVARIAVRADQLVVGHIPLRAVEREPVAHVQRIFNATVI